MIYDFLQNNRFVGFAHFRISFESHFKKDTIIPQLKATDNEKCLWEVLIHSDLDKWQPVEIEVESGKKLVSYPNENGARAYDYQSSRDDDEFQRLKENLYTSSLRYNTESRLHIRFSPSLHINIPFSSNNNISPDLFSSQVN